MQNALGENPLNSPFSVILVSLLNHLVYGVMIMLNSVQLGGDFNDRKKVKLTK